MQMGVDHDRNVVGRKSGLRKSILEPGAATLPLVLDSVDRRELFVFLVSRSGVDEYRTRWVLHQHAAHAELDAVSLVRRDTLLPQWLRNDTEHRAAIELLASRLNRVDLEASQRTGLDGGADTHAVVSFVIGPGSALGRRFFRFVFLKRISESRSCQVVQPRCAASSSRRIRQCAVAMASPPARCRRVISTP